MKLTKEQIDSLLNNFDNEWSKFNTPDVASAFDSLVTTLKNFDLPEPTTPDVEAIVQAVMVAIDKDKINMIHATQTGVFRLDQKYIRTVLRTAVASVVGVNRMDEIKRRHDLIMSEPNGIVRDTMIANLLMD
jgi:hypothetical protein